jgi:metal-responsive CopG/Arc/MetJ family transcriptional regulator
MDVQNKKVKKMARPTDWDEPKERHQIRLTPTCWRHLGDVADANGLPSRAEAIEHLSRYAVKQSISFKSDDISLEEIASLDRIATLRGISRSELIERIARDEEVLMRMQPSE